ncbi:cell division protein ZipA C-terminal FtsZ-binding domain-containing protein [Vreelandella profundi]|uniref:cell division protein ZipA C-terminal FtsZ-binding domain-containing protein n=1 Tax=Vreelandella profundi TaxID=2852117 RepID=UPI001EEF9F20|nr:cell division protein ZipA C-terminal FtsZ-binding domain-containing protein [Halomonas profundi]
MELREWLIILGLALVSLIVIDGVRRLQRQRRVPRLDQAEKDLSASQLEDPDDAAKAAEINWELPNGGARVVKPADYSGLGSKPKLERQEHPGASRVLAEFRRSATAKVAKRKAEKAEKAEALAFAKASPAAPQVNIADTAPEHERREPSVSFTAPQAAQSASASIADSSAATETPVSAQTPPVQASAPELAVSEAMAPEVATTPAAASISASESVEAPVQPERENVLRAEPEDAAFAKHASSDAAPKRRKLRSDTVGEHDELDDDQVDEYRLVDFEGMGRSFKRRLIERRLERQRKKAEKAICDKALAKQKAERKALEAEQRREAKEAADAERARLAQEQAQAREVAASAAAADRLVAQQRIAEEEERRETERYSESYSNSHSDSHSDRHAAYEDGYDHADERGEYASDDSFDDRGASERESNQRVRVHPTLEKALRHDVNGEHAKETLSGAEEVVVISVLSRDPEGFDGSKLLELMMVCGLRYSSGMGIFHRFETESEDSELQFSMVNVVKPGTFPIQEMGEFMTPGVTLLMPLPGAVDSSAAFEAMVETAMVLVRHMGGELKDENRSVMTAQTIEFARQRVREFERRHRLHRHMQAR